MKLALLIVLLAGCDAGTVPPLADLGGADAGGDLARVATSGTPPPVGYGSQCVGSTDCAGYENDAPPGRLGCYAFIGVPYCSRPCGGAADPACWRGTACQCANRINVSGYPETDCFCAKD